MRAKNLSRNLQDRVRLDRRRNLRARSHHSIQTAFLSDGYDGGHIMLIRFGLQIAKRYEATMSSDLSHPYLYLIKI
jgi:hypothetical protein